MEISTSDAPTSLESATQAITTIETTSSPETTNQIDTFSIIMILIGSVNIVLFTLLVAQYLIKKRRRTNYLPKTYKI